MDVDQAIERHLRANRNLKLQRRFTATIAAIYEVGGVMGVLHWATARIEQGLGSVSERSQLETLLHQCHLAQERWNRNRIKEWEREAERRRYVALWAHLLNERDLQLRAKARRESPDPRELIRRRLERTLRKPCPPAPRPRRLTAAQRMDRSWRRRKYLTAGQ